MRWLKRYTGFAVLGLIITFATLPPPALALWSKLNTLAIGEERICKDGASFGVAYKPDGNETGLKEVQVDVYYGLVNGDHPLDNDPQWQLKHSSDFPTPYNPIWINGFSEENNPSKVFLGAGSIPWTRTVNADITVYLSENDPNKGFSTAVYYKVQNCLIQPVRTVGTGSAASCTEAALDAALVDARTIFFNCGADETPENNGRTITLTTTKKITRDVTIYGNGLITLSGNNTLPIFHVMPGVTLDLRYLQLFMGRSNGNGGAIYNDRGKLSAVGVQFFNSVAAGAGGAVYSNGGSLSITESIFLGNVSGGDGGGLYSAGDALTQLEGVNFEYNLSQTGRGGAIYRAEGLNGSRLIFLNNQALEGGGVYTQTGGLVFAQTRFEGNIAQNGGAVYINGGSLTASLNNNKPASTIFFFSNTASGSGGAIYNNNGVITVESATFGSNIAEQGNGGAIYNAGANARFIATLSSFSNNTANNTTPPADGGVIYNLLGRLQIAQSTLSNNFAARYGGAVAMFGGTSAFIASTFDNNFAQFGSALANLNQANTTFTNSTVSINTANTAGAIYNTPPGDVNLDFSSITNNNGHFNQAGGLQGSGIRVSRSIISNNYSKNCSDPLQQIIYSLQYDANFANETACGSNISHGDPFTSPLDENGGPTRTVAIHSLSFASNILTGSDCPPGTLDQRGIKRTLTLPCDLGAIEVTPQENIVVKLNGDGNLNTMIRGNFYDVTLSMINDTPGKVARGVNIVFNLPPLFRLIDAVEIKDDANNPLVKIKLPCSQIFNTVNCYLGDIVKGSNRIITWTLLPLNLTNNTSITASVRMVDNNVAAVGLRENFPVVAFSDDIGAYISIIDDPLTDISYVNPGATQPTTPPVLTSVQIEGNRLRIQGTLRSAGSKTFTINFYKPQQGLLGCFDLIQNMIGSTIVTTDVYGFAQFNSLLTQTVNVNDLVNARVVSPAANSSVQSACLSAVNMPSPANAAPVGGYITTTHQVPLTWIGVTWAKAYEVQINSSDSWNGDYNYIAQTTDRQLTTPHLNNGQYYWRVRAQINDTQWGAWSTTQPIIVNAP